MKKKVQVIKNEISEHDTFSINFGDSMGDAPMLGAVDLPFQLEVIILKLKILQNKKVGFQEQIRVLLLKRYKRKLINN